MSNLREAYSATALASLEWKQEAERAIDRVAAAGLANPLGVALWRSKYLLESKSYGDAKKGLADLYRARHSHETPAVVEIIVEQVLHEYLSDKCVTCNGAKETIVGELRVMCGTCSGSGVRNYGDYQRAQTMKISLDRVRRLSRFMGWLADMVGTLDGEVNRVMSEQLERE